MMIAIDVSKNEYAELHLGKDLADILIERPQLLLLWYRGIYTLIPIEIVMNAIDEYNIYQQLSRFDLKVIIKWEQGWEIEDPNIGEQLFDDCNRS